MQVFEAHTTRAVAIELKEKVNSIYFDVLPVFYAVSTWKLNSIDPDMPEPFDIKVQLDAYQALTIQRLKLTDWIAALQTAQNGDTLAYPPPPAMAGQFSFDEIAFEHLNF
jgi:hypothetical protein